MAERPGQTVRPIRPLPRSESETINETLSFIAYRGWQGAKDDFFTALVTHLTDVLGVAYALVDRVVGDGNEAVETVALSTRGEISKNVAYGLAGTPCENVIGKELCCYAEKVRMLFPEDELLVEMEAESYVGIPLWRGDGEALGLIAVMDDKPLENPDLVGRVLKIVALRAAAELERGIILSELEESRQRFQDFATATSDWFWEMDESLRYTWFSSNIERVTGVPAASYYGKTRQELGVPDDAPDLWEEHLRILNAHKPFKDFVFLHDGPDGDRWMCASGTPIFDDKGEFRGYRGTGSDITDRKNAEIAIAESEDLLDSLIENIPVGLLLKNTNQIIERANSTFLDWYGFREDQVVGNRSLDVAGLQSPAEIDVMLAHEVRVLETGDTQTRFVDRLFADGRVHTIGVTKFPVYNRDRNLMKVGSVSVDMTEQVEVRNALLRSEERFRDFAESASDWLWEIDDEHRFTYVSERYREVTGFDPEHYIGKTRENVSFEATDTPEWQKHVDDLANLRPFRNYMFDVAKSDGSTRTVSINGKPVFDSDGKFIGYRGTGSDVTAQVSAQRARDKALEEAQNANQAKSNFLANMSHDLRTPLNAIMGFSEVLREEMFGRLGNQKYREYADDIHLSASFLLELVNDLLDISTIESGKRVLQKQTLPVATLIQECLDALIGRAYVKDIQISTGVPENLHPLFADRQAVQQILLNLLTNAIKFTPNSGKIEISAKSVGDHTEIIIEDTGDGIPHDRVDDVLQPFVQGKRDPFEADPGHGLGLAIAHSLVELHGGTLSIDSTVGIGTTVTISLPRGDGAPDGL